MVCLVGYEDRSKIHLHKEWTLPDSLNSLDLRPNILIIERCSFVRRFWLCLDRKLNNQGRNGLTIIPFILHVNPQCLTSSVEHNADPIQNQKMQRTHSDVSVILTCACSTCTPGCGHSPAPPLQAVQQTQAKSATKAPSPLLQTAASETRIHTPPLTGSPP